MDDAERVAYDRLFLDFLADRQRTMGNEQGGLSAFYSRRLERRVTFNPSEQAAIACVREELPLYRSYVEIGPGMGQLVCWLAICGLNAVAIERDTARYAGLTALQARVVERWPHAVARLSSIHGSFPCPMPHVEAAASLVLSTNLVFGASYEVEQGVIDGMIGFAAALVDTVRFCRDRSDPAAWAELDARFAAAGFVEQRTMWAQNTTGGGSPERLMWYSRSGSDGSAHP